MCGDLLYNYLWGEAYVSVAETRLAIADCRGWYTIAQVHYTIPSLGYS